MNARPIAVYNVSCVDCSTEYGGAIHITAKGRTPSDLSPGYRITVEEVTASKSAPAIVGAEDRYAAGRREAFAEVLRFFSEQMWKTDLSHDGKRPAGAVLLDREAERLETVTALREACAEHGDNRWDERLYLPDVIRKHLLPYLDDRKAITLRMLKEFETLTNTKLGGTNG